jgi:lysophospholipase L1-like esterase
MKFCGSRACFSRCFLLACLAAALTLSCLRPALANWLFSYPPNMVKLDSGKRDNVFLVGDPIGFTLDIANYGTYNLSGPVHYEVRDYWGGVVDQGTASAPTPTTTSTLALRAEPPGWYKLYLHGPGSVAPWGDSIGGTMFVVFRPGANFPTMPDPHVPGNSGVFDGDEVARGVTAMGPQRHPVTDASQPDAAIALLDPSIALDKQYYTAAPFNDAARSRPLLIAFPNGISSADPAQQSKNLAGLRQIVAHFHNDVKYWEPLNEPNGKYSGADYVAKELIPFYQTVKSVDPTCKVLGPGVVTVGPYGLNWTDGFLKAGGAGYIDAFSFHAYNNVNGDLTLARKSLDALQALLTKYGIPNIEKWQTEQGYFAAVYGAYQPRLQGRWTMLQMMVYEQYNIPKEHNHLWYDKSHGFWDVPAFWENEDGPSSFGSFDPAAPLMRVWSEELYGTNFSRAYDFGALGNKMYVGSLFGGTGKQVAAFMSAGRTDGQVTLNVTGGASVHVVSAFGVAQDLPVAAGQVTLPVPELPVYVELAPGQTLEVVPTDYGPDLALTPGTTASASGSAASPLDPSFSNDPAKIINGVLENWYWNQGPDDHPWMSNVTSFPATVQVTLPLPMAINHVVLYAGVPWQNDGSLLDYELQYDKGGQWVTVSHVQESPTIVPFFTPTVFTTVDSFYSDRCVFQHDFPTVTTQKIRLLVHDTTWGGGATQGVVQAGGQTGPHQITLREMELYGPGGQPVPLPQGKIRYFPRRTMADRMLGGRFQGSADGVIYTTLATVTSVPVDGQWAETVLYTDPAAYRYLRYVSPNGSYGNVNEVEFYSGTGTGAVKLSGTPFGSPGSYGNSGNTFAKVFDGDVNTCFDGPGPNGNYAGLDQGAAPVVVPTVTGVSVTPSAASVAGGQSQQFSATVSGTGGPSQAVTWTATAGAVSASGLFTAPAASAGVQAVTVTATSTADPTRSAAATVTIPAVVTTTGGGRVRFFPRLGSANRMLGGRFQGSADGTAYTDLYVVTSVPAEGQWAEAPLASDPKGYRYLRYLSPDGGWGNVSEVEFYSGTGTGSVKLSGTPYGSPGSFYNSGSTFAKVFDGDVNTCFDGPGPNGNYAGIDQGAAPVVVPTVTGVSVTPSAASVAGGQSQQFSATVSGTGGPSQAVTWSATAGAVSASGLFTAPAASAGVQAVTVTATSVADPTKSATATVTIPAAAGTTPGALNIGFLGDSITHGVGDNGGPGAYDVALADLSLNGYQVTGVNYGNNGASVFSFYQQTDGPLKAFKKAGVAVVSIMLGTNDARMDVNTSPQDYHDKLLGIINSFLADGTGIQKVILNYSPYIQPSSSTAWGTGADAQLQAYQAQIDSLCNGSTILQGDQLAYRFFQQHPEQGDGVHPTPQGHQDLGKLWAIGITHALGGMETLSYPTGAIPHRRR